MTRLFGRICEPSTAHRGVESWISSLRATRASPSATQVLAAGLKTLAISGPTSCGSCANATRASCSSRTSQAISPSDSERSAPTFDTWASELKQDFSRRLKQALLTVARGSSLWPTAAGGLHNYFKEPSSFLARRERLKATKVNGNGAGMPLGIAVRLWGTPTARDGKDGACANANVPVNGLLGRQVVKLWPTTTAMDSIGSGAAAYTTESGRHAGVTLTDAAVRGPLSPATTQAIENSSVGTRRLNPRWTCLLMGWAPSWTSSGSPETVSSPSKPHSRSRSLRNFF
jgi:hypothetical protein